MTGELAGRWLVMGHGSVGSVLVRRLHAVGVEPHVFDPEPRVAIQVGEHVGSLGSGMTPYDYVISCVSPAASLEVPLQTAPVVDSGTILLDWNSVTPSVKQEIASRSPASVVDVALLDTLDEDSQGPSLATSGEAAGAATAVLVSLGFHVDVVGDTCGDAARLKLARSLFMKTHEALVVEFEASIATLPGRDVVRASIERNTGETFGAFARLLLRTDQLHAARRFVELESAVQVYQEAGRPVHLAASAIDVLRAAADAWARPDAPAPGSDLDDLAMFLGEHLHAHR